MFAEQITYNNNFNKFSISIEDWWVVHENYDKIKFTGSNGLGAIELVVFFGEGEFSVSNLKAVDIIRTVFQEFCPECENVVEHPLENLGIVTIDGIDFFLNGKSDDFLNCAGRV